MSPSPLARAGTVPATEAPGAVPATYGSEAPGARAGTVVATPAGIDSRAASGPAAPGAREGAALDVLILSGDTGEGHHAAARAVAKEIVQLDPGARVEIRDGLRLCGKFVNGVVRGGCRMQLLSDSAATLYGLIYDALVRFPVIRRTGYFLLLRRGARPLGRYLAGRRPQVVVSTHPVVSVVLGCLRTRFGLECPTATVILDLGGLQFWAAPGVDLHLVMDEKCITEVERLEPGGRAVGVRPIVDPSFFQPFSPRLARRELGLPLDVPLVLVSGGGWGVGDMAGAVETVLQLPSAHALCVTGRNQSLQSRLWTEYSSNPRVHLFGFTQRMNELLAAADAIVHSTGGITCLEALVRGCPLITYGTPPGHALDYCAAMEAAGLSRQARTRADLLGALAKVLAEPRPAPADVAGYPSPAQAILELVNGSGS